MIRTITQRRLAGLANVGEMVVSKLVKGRLSKCKIVQNGRSKGLNVDSALIVEWLATHNVFYVDDKYCRIILTKKEQELAQNKSNAAPLSRRPEVVKEVTSDAPTQERSDRKKEFNNEQQSKIGTYNVDDLEHLTLREIIDRYGSIDGFKRFVESERIMLDNGIKEQKLNKARGDLIELVLVKRVVIDSYDLAFNMLVSDIPSRITQQIIATVTMGGSDVVPDIERIYRDSISTVLKNLKTKISKSKVLGVDT